MDDYLERTCYECGSYRLTDGLCFIKKDYHKSCGEMACSKFTLAEGIKKMEEREGK